MIARRIRIIVYLILIVVTIKFSLNNIIGATLEKIFTDGTNCHVHLANPKFSFLRLKLSIENVVIRHPSEALDAGFRVDKVSIKLDGAKLLHRELRLNDLKIEGARATSLQKESGFINLLTFLFPPKKKEEPVVESKGMLAQFFDSLHFHITTIEILNSKKTINQLIIGDNSTRFRFKNIHLLFTEQNFDYRKPYDVEATGQTFSILNEKNLGNTYGNLKLNGVMGGGKVILQESSLGYDHNLLNVVGEIVLGSDGFYNLDASSNLQADYFLKVFGEDSIAKPAELKLSGKISGILDSPEFVADIEASFPEDGISYLKSGATPSKIKTNLNYRNASLIFDNFELSTQPNLKKISINFREGDVYDLKVIEKNNNDQNLDTFKVDVSVDAKQNIFTLKELLLKNYKLSDFSLYLGLFFNREQLELVKDLANQDSKIDLQLQAECSFSGNCTAKGQTAINNFNLFQVPFKNLKLSLNKPKDKKDFLFELANLELFEGTAKGKISTLESSEKLAGEVILSNLNLQKFPYLENLQEGFSGTAQGKIKVLGTLSSPQLESELLIQNRFTNYDKVSLSSSVSAKLDLTKFEAQADILSGKLKAKIFYPLEEKPKNQFTLQVDANQFPLDQFINPNELISQSSLSAKLNYAASQSDIFSGLGNLTIPNLTIFKNDLLISSLGELNIDISQGQIKFRNVKLKVQDKELIITGFYDRSRGWQTAINGNWELATLLKDTSFFEQLNGLIKFNLNVKGEFSNPTFFGPLQAEGVTISFPLGNNIVGLNEGLVEAELNGDRLDISKISTKYAGSKILGSGYVNQIFSPEREIHVSFETPKIYFEPIDNLNFEAAGKLLFSKKQNDPYLLSGLINIDNALYEDILSFRTLISAITDFVSGKRTRKIRTRNLKANNKDTDLHLDIDFRAKNGLVLETNIAQAELSCDLNLSGTLEDPVLDGRITALEGNFGLQSKQFDILNGQVTFSKDAKDQDPEISVIGETSIITRFGEEQRINLLIKGPISNPRADFRSDNGLRKEEIQSLLGLGAGFETLNQNSSYSNKRSIKDIINPTTNIPIEDRIFDLTGFSSLQFGYNFSEQTGEVTPIVTAIKDLTNYLQLQLQTELGGSESSFAGVDYLLNSNFNLTTGWRTSSAIKQQNTNVGSFDFGITYRNSYFGYNLFPTTTSNKWESLDLR